MINKMKLRKGGYSRGVSNSAMYQLKLNPEGDAIDCSIERLDGESNQAYANRIEKIFESARVPNQQNLYQFNSLSLHPSEGDKFTDAQMIEMAKEVYLKNGVKNGLSENRHTMFVVERNTKHHHVHAMIHLTDLETKKVNNKMIDYNPIIKKLELKYGLYNEHRKPKTEDEYKKKFKKDLKTILDNALNPSEFLMLANGAGFDIHHSGKDAYSMTKDGQTFKASDLAVSYKTLKAALGDDPEFAATLASLHTDKPGNDDSGSITAPTSEAPSQDPTPAPANQSSAAKAPANQATDHDADYDDYAAADWRSKYAEQQRVEKKKQYAEYYDNGNYKNFQGHQKTLYVNYHHDEDGNYYFNRNDKKAFEFEASTGTVKYDRVTPSSAKAGLQKLMEDKNNRDIYVTGGEKFKREMWLQFHLMSMSEKGYSFEGFKPSKKDVEELERQLEDKTKYYNRSQDSNIKSLPTEKVAEKTVEPLAIKSTEKPTAIETEKPTVADAANGVKNAGMDAASTAATIAAGVMEGALEKIVDVFAVHDAQGPMNEMLSEMRVLDAQNKESQKQAENEQHENKKRRLQKFIPQ
ncbi:hypothetical protein M2399_002590 [Pseudomonas sp. BIGb0450]|uniref:relaxase/mobilization nuclease domain-containing protein n=1 Tax=unclassified Pseudomonas TaxID=196821 RepID=UPI002167A042|nr:MULTISPECIES: relaxase/mobilization nuclease domain-containing protein [unclassified Pseudomonas]MCS3417140.1 hypothetical protein [Pseudomonas sp. BIGb0558]MCS3437153.1 hypothetical protein [Pseudomonas sp. BIGb0450]